jgi:hypothetical protein
MLIFEKSPTQKELCCFDVSLKSDFTIDVRPIFITYAEVVENLSLNHAKPIHLLGNTGVFFKLKRGIGEMKLTYSEAPSKDVETYKNLVKNSNYNWCAWCLITPTLATNDTIHENMNFTMFPIFEKGTFSNEQYKNTIFTFGTYPVVLYESYTNFIEEFMRAAHPKDGDRTSLIDVMEKQQQLVVPASEFKNDDYNGLLFRNSTSIRAITRADYDIVNTLIAQMVSFARVGIKFKNCYCAVVQEAMCNATQNYSIQSEREEHLDIFDVTNEERRLWGSSWEAYVNAVIFRGERVKKLAVQVGLDPRKIGTMRNDDTPSYNEAEVDSFFKDLTFKMMNGHKAERVEYFAFNNEINAVITRRANTSIPKDIMEEVHYGNPADCLTYNLWRSWDKMSTNRKKDFRINWEAEKSKPSSRPYPTDPTLYMPKPDDPTLLQGFMAWAATHSNFSAGLTRQVQLVGLATKISELHSGNTEDAIKIIMSDIVDTYREACRKTVPDNSSAETIEKLTPALINIRTIIFAAVMTRVKDGNWSCEKAQQKLGNSDRIDGATGVSIEPRTVLEENFAYEESRGLDSSKTLEYEEIRNKFEGDDDCKKVTVSDLVFMKRHQEKETVPGATANLVKIFTEAALRGEGKTAQEEKYGGELAELTVQVFLGKFHEAESRRFQQVAVLDQFEKYKNQFGAMYEFLKMEGKAIPKAGSETVTGKQLTGFNPFTKSPVYLQFDDIEPPEITLSMLPMKKPPMPTFPLKKFSAGMSMKNFIRIKAKAFFERWGIENNNLKARFLYRMWEEGGEQLPVFMSWFPREIILTINSDVAYKSFVEEIVKKYDKPTGDRTYMYQGLVRKSFQKSWESIEAYVMRMKIYYFKWKQIKSMEQGSTEMIEFTNAVVHKLADRNIRDKITNSANQVGLVQDGRLDDIVRFVNDTRRGQDYIQQQKQIYGGIGARSNAPMDRRNKYGGHGGTNRKFSRRFVNYAEILNVNVDDLDGKHLNNVDCNDPDEVEFQLCSGVEDLFNREVNSQNNPDAGELEINFSRHNNSPRKGRLDKRKPKTNFSRNNHKNHSKQNSSRKQFGKGRFNKKRNYDGKRDDRGVYKRPAKKFTAQDFTRQKSYAKRVLGFRRALKDKNTDRSRGGLKNQVPSWFKGAPKDFVPKEEYFKMRKNHLQKGPIKVAKKEKNQHKNEVINNVEYTTTTRAWQDELNDLSTVLDDITEDNMFDIYNIFEVQHVEADNLDDSDGESEWEDADEDKDYYDQSSDDDYDEYDPDECCDYLGGLRVVNMNEIFNLDEVDVVSGKSTSTFFLDIFIDFDSKTRVKDFEYAVKKDVAKFNSGANETAKFASISALWDTGATANLIPFEVIKRYMPHKIGDIIKTPNAEIVGANKSAIETVGKISLDFSMAAYPLKASIGGRRPQEIQFKKINFYVCKGIARTIIGEQVIHFLNDTQGVLFSQAVGKMPVPKDHMVIGLANTTDTNKLRVIKFYKDKPTNKFTNCPNTMNIPVNHIEPKEALQYSEIFTIDTQDCEDKKVNLPQHTFQIFTSKTGVLRPNEEKVLAIRHDNTRRLNGACDLTGLNGSIDIRIVDQNTAKVRNTGAVTQILRNDEPIALIYDKCRQQHAVREIFELIEKETKYQDDKYPLANPTVIENSRNYENVRNFEVNSVDWSFASVVKRKKDSDGNPQKEGTAKQHTGMRGELKCMCKNCPNCEKLDLFPKPSSVPNQSHLEKLENKAFLDENPIVFPTTESVAYSRQEGRETPYNM